VAEVNDRDLTDVYARRNHVLDLLDQLVTTWTPAEAERLLAAALASSADVDVLLAACESGEK
jgi:hypothetical protein